jgi:hypothetical protein
VLFEGVSLPLEALKRAIVDKKGLTSSGVDLVVTDAQTGAGACMWRRACFLRSKLLRATPCSRRRAFCTREIAARAHQPCAPMLLSPRVFSHLLIPSPLALSAPLRPTPSPRRFPAARVGAQERVRARQDQAAARNTRHRAACGDGRRRCGARRWRRRRRRHHRSGRPALAHVRSPSAGGSRAMTRGAPSRSRL